MRLYYSKAQLSHRPTQFMMLGRLVAPFEVPERASALADALISGGLTPAPVKDYGKDALLAVHAGHYLSFLEEAWRLFGELADRGPELLPNIHPYRGAAGDLSAREAPRATSIIGRAGWYVGDLACAIMEGTYEAAYASAQAAINGAHDILSGSGAAFSLCRPPGHHAYADRASGFCFLNNAAIAAELLRQRFSRVAIVDFDTHHGDGTQAIFYRRGDIFYGSVHTDPAVYYPYFAGYADEAGEGEGRGTTLNLPLAPGSGDEQFIDANRRLIEAVNTFSAEALVISAGWDAHRDDPLSKLKVTNEAFAQIGHDWGAVQLPTLIVQEGGYSLSASSAAAPAFMRAFSASHNG